MTKHMRFRWYRYATMIVLLTTTEIAAAAQVATTSGPSPDERPALRSSIATDGSVASIAPTPTKRSREGKASPARRGPKSDWEDSRFDIGGGFTYEHKFDANSHLKNNPGFHVSAFYNVNRWLSLGGEYRRLFIDADLSPGLTYTSRTDLYLFGPQFTVYRKDRVNLFAKALAGVARDRSVTKFNGTNSPSVTNHGTALSFGGGVDVRVNQKLAIRAVQFDWVDQHEFGFWQKGIMFSTGIVVKLGKR